MNLHALCPIVLFGPALAGCGPRVLFEAQRPECACTLAVIEESGDQRVRVGNRDEKTYLAIGAAAFALSPDGRHIAYPARTDDGWIAVIDGAESPPYDGIAEMVWSSDGRHIAYAAEQRGQWLVVHDGKPGPLHEHLQARSLRFSPGGTHFAYVAQENGRVFAVAGGRRSALYDGIGHLLFAAEGRLVFAARRGEVAFVVTGNVESPPYQDLAEIAVSPSGRRIAWTARTTEGWRVIEEASPPGEPFERISPLVFSPRGERLAYAARRGTDEVVVHEGQTSPPYEAVMPQSLVFGAQGTSLAFAARREHQWHVVIDHAPGPPFDALQPPVFIGSSSVVAHLAQRGESTLLVAGTRQTPVPAGAAGLVLSPDGKRYAYVAPDRGNTMVVIHGRIDGAPGCEQGCTPTDSGRWPAEMFLEGSVVFSDDGAHVGFVAGDTAAKSLFFCVDGAKARRIATGEIFTLAIEPTGAPAGPADSRPSVTDFAHAEMTRWIRQQSPTPRSTP